MPPPLPSLSGRPVGRAAPAPPGPRLPPVPPPPSPGVDMVEDDETYEPIDEVRFNYCWRNNGGKPHCIGT